MIDVDASELVEELEDLGDRARDLRPVLDAIIGDFHTLMAGAFDTRGAAIGRRWAANVPGWSAEKGSDPVGVFTGLLRGSLTQFNAQHAIHDRTPNGVKLGTSAPHAGLFDAGRGGQRARRLEPSAGRLEKWVGMLQQHLDGDTAGGFDGIV